MAEKAEKKPEEKPAAAAAGHGEEKKAAKGGLFKSTPIMLGLVMVLEAVVLFAGFKFLGGGAKSVQGANVATPEEHEAGEHAEGGEHGEHGEHEAGTPATKTDKKKPVEVEVLHKKEPNRQNGRLILYDVQIVAVTRFEHENKVKTVIKDREALIQDRIRTIVAQSDPEKLGGGAEPGLETLRRQVKYQLDEIIGEGMIDEVLVPTCIPFQAGL